MRIRALIIDDEKLARLRLIRMLLRHEVIEIVGETGNSLEAGPLIEEVQPDVIFLDIRMPQLSGFDILKRLKKSPYIIFTTAYNEYALQAFEENTVDYLLKPISEEKLKRAISKILNIIQQGRPAGIDLEKLLRSLEKKDEIMRRFSVKIGDRIMIFADDKISYFHADDKYTFLHTEDKDFIIPFPLKELERKLDPEKFIRVHRAFIVNLENIASIHRWFGGRLLLKIKNRGEITVSAKYLKKFKEKIHLS
jgi:DNA-binding LytR/AlgR family response regulator